MKKCLALLSTSLLLPSLAIAEDFPLPPHEGPPPPSHNVFIHPQIIGSKIEMNNSVDLGTLASIDGATAIKLSDSAYLTSAPGFALLKPDNIKDISLASVDAPVEGGSVFISLPASYEMKSFDLKNAEPPKPLTGPNVGGIYIVAKRAGPLGSLIDVAITKPETVTATGVSYTFAQQPVETNLAKGLTLLIKDPTNPNVVYSLSFNDNHIHPPHPKPFEDRNHRE